MGMVWCENALSSHHKNIGQLPSAMWLPCFWIGKSFSRICCSNSWPGIHSDAREIETQVAYLPGREVSAYNILAIAAACAKQILWEYVCVVLAPKVCARIYLLPSQRKVGRGIPHLEKHHPISLARGLVEQEKRAIGHLDWMHVAPTKICWSVLVTVFWRRWNLDTTWIRLH